MELRFRLPARPNARVFTRLFLFPAVAVLLVLTTGWLIERLDAERFRQTERASVLSALSTIRARFDYLPATHLVPSFYQATLISPRLADRYYRGIKSKSVAVTPALAYCLPLEIDLEMDLGMNFKVYVWAFGLLTTSIRQP